MKNSYMDQNIDLTPFLDVVLVIIIFFVTAYSVFDGNLISQPNVKDNIMGCCMGCDALYLEINEHGEYFINEKYIVKPNLEHEVRSRFTPLDHSGVSIRVSGKSKVESYIYASDIIKKIGIENLTYSVINSN